MLNVKVNVIMMKPWSMYWMYSAAPSSLPLPSMSPVLWLRRIAACQNLHNQSDRDILHLWLTVMITMMLTCKLAFSALSFALSMLAKPPHSCNSAYFNITPLASRFYVERKWSRRRRLSFLMILSLDIWWGGIINTWNIPSSTSPPLIAVAFAVHLNFYPLSSNQHPSLLSSLPVPAALSRNDCESLKCTLSFY